MHHEKEDGQLTSENQPLRDEEEIAANETQRPSARKPWQPMRLSFTGDAKDVIQQGGGKLSAPGGDPGEGKKQGPSL
jgi:hypothetical protein